MDSNYLRGRLHSAAMMSSVNFVVTLVTAVTHYVTTMRNITMVMRNVTMVMVTGVARVMSGVVAELVVWCVVPNKAVFVGNLLESGAPFLDIK